jgi:hypothetical protein
MMTMKQTKTNGKAKATGDELLKSVRGQVGDKALASVRGGAAKKPVRK